MDSRNVSFLSQSFFASGKRKESNLSLTCKRSNKSDRPVDNSSLKKIEQVSSESLQNEPASTSVPRCNSAEMEKFLEKFKNPRQVGRVSSNRGGRRSTTKIFKNDGGKSEKSPEGTSSDFKRPFPPVSDVSIVKKSAQGSEKAEVLLSANGSENSSSVPEGNSETFHEDRTITDQTLSEVSESNILLCPICWKPFDCKDAQTVHMKACASKNNVSTKQLLELLELIQKQEEERKALGIPLLPPKVPKKLKKESLISSIKPKSNLDGNIQLGIALSVSLQEAEQLKERDHLLEAGLFEEVKEKGLLPDQDADEENHLPTAPIFLNVGKKGSNTGIGVSRGRKKLNKFGGRIPTLLKRTPEDREKLITEKVAIIIVGDEHLNSIFLADDKENLPVWKIKSRILSKYTNEEQVLWKMAGLSPSSSSKDQFYVHSLSNFISPCKVPAGSKLKHLSQIPGRNSTPTDNSSSNKLPDFGKFEEGILSSSLSMGVKLDHSCGNEKKESKRSLFAETVPTTKQNTLSRDWIVLVGNPEMSDVKVYTEGERVIPAHKLVFFARCPLIIKDLVVEEKEGRKSNLLLWVEICYGAAFLFLKYLYGGVFSKSEAKSDKVLEDLNSLAERYEVRDLMALLDRTGDSEEENVDSLQDVERKVNNTMACEEMIVQEDNSSKAKIDEDLVVEDGNISIFERMNLVNKSPQGLEEKHTYDEQHDLARELKENDTCCRSETDKNDDLVMNSPSDHSIASNLGRCSPDIFQMTREVESPESVEVIEDNDPPITQESSQDSRESIEYLVSLMEKDSSINKSSECDPESVEGDEEKSHEDTYVNSYVPESPSIFLQNSMGGCSMDETVPPKTPALDKVEKYLVVSSTPLVQQAITYGVSSNTIKENETDSAIEAKRKLHSLDKSDRVSPSPKKIRIEGEDNDKKSCKEVVDLTLSGSDEEEDAEVMPRNDSNCSTLPPDAEELSPSKGSIPQSPPASPCVGYISNVWDDFDYVPDVPKVDFNDSVSASQKNLMNEKENEEVCRKEELVSEEKIGTNEMSELRSPRLCDSPDSIILLDEKVMDKEDSSQITSAQDIAGSKEKEEDITEKLLDVSLSQINDSVFWKDENEPKEGAEASISAVPCHTPVRRDLKAVLSDHGTPESPLYTKKANVTPLADYSAMKTPMLHKELDRYGIKHLKRNQAKQLLRHIYHELHPIVSGENEIKNPDSASSEKDKLPIGKGKSIAVKDLTEKRKITFQNIDSGPEDENSSSDESSGSNSDFDVLEESMIEPQFESPIKSQALSQKGPSVDIPTAMKKLLENDTALHEKVLLYEPIWLADLKAGLKEHGAKFNIKQLMDYLDEQCITFRIEQKSGHRRRKTKKTFSLSQPCNQKRKNKQLISSSQPS